MKEVPEPWASAMLAKDFTHAKRPNIRALTRASGVGSAETVRRMIYGIQVPDTDTVERVAAALGKSPVEVSEWVNQQRTTRRTYAPPREVALLTEDEQDAIDGLIRAIAKGRRPERKPPTRTQRRLRVVETGPERDEQIPDAATERRRPDSQVPEGDTPPGTSEEPTT